MDHGYGYGYGTYGSGNFWSKGLVSLKSILWVRTTSSIKWTFPSRNRSRSRPRPRPCAAASVEPRSSHVLHPFLL